MAESRSGLELIRATPYELCRLCIEDALLRDLAETPCVNPRCQPSKGEKGLLSKLRFGKKRLDRNISTQSVWYRCTQCQRKCSAHTGSLLFRGLATEASP